MADVGKLKAEAYDISLKMGELQKEFNELNERLVQVKSQIDEAEKPKTGG